MNKSEVAAEAHHYIYIDSIDSSSSSEDIDDEELNRRFRLYFRPEEKIIPLPSRYQILTAEINKQVMMFSSLPEGLHRF